MVRFFILALIIFFSPTVNAEADKVRIARQFGINYLPLIVMQENKILEKHLEAEGIKNTNVSWMQLGDATSINEALISGNIDFATTGPAPMITLWDKTLGNLNVKAVAALNVIPMHLITNNPNIHSIKDFTKNDKIALPGAKISTQAIVLQMASGKEFGEKNYKKLDELTVTMSHPDAMATLLSSKPVITAHFSTPPYSFDLLEKQGFHAVISSEDILGPSVGNVVFTTASFKDKNPKINKAFFEALEEAISIINKDKAKAAALYVSKEKSNYEAAFITKLLQNPSIKFQTPPLGIMKYAEFMHKTGLIKNKPSSWKDLFFSEADFKEGS